MSVATTTRQGLRALPGELPALVEAFRRHDLLLYASAISFQVLTAIVPVALFVLGLLGFLDLTEIWQRDVRSEIVGSVSPALLTVIDDTVERVLEAKQLFWVTGGFLLATWQLSGAVRAAMDALNRVHEATETRSWPGRYARSFALAIAMAGLVLGAVAVVALLPVVDGDPGPVLGAVEFVARWAVGAVFLLLAIGLIVHFGPDREQPLAWVSAGAVIVMACWLGMSAAFGLYLTTIASYGSVFGALATFVVLTGYLYASAVTFVAGIQMDALLRARQED